MNILVVSTKFIIMQILSIIKIIMMENIIIATSISLMGGTALSIMVRALTQEAHLPSHQSFSNNSQDLES
jgi:hypothetical protein